MKTMITHLSPGRRSPGLRFALAAVVLLLTGFSAGAQLTAQIGTGTSQYSTTSTPPSPLGSYYPTVRVQYMYTAAELTTAGFTTGNIDQIAFQVGTNTGSTAFGFNISIDSSSQTNLNATTSWRTSTTLKYSNLTGQSAGPGWNVFTFTTPFYWNGLTNIIIDVCHARGSTGLTGAAANVVYHTATGRSIYAVGNSAASYCGINFISPTNTTARPNIRFTRLSQCTGTPNKGVTIPSGTISGNCPGTQFTIADTGSTNALNIVYQWMQSTNGGTTWTPAAGAGANTAVLRTPPLVATTRYHLVVTCNNSTFSDSTADVIFSFTGGFPVYATLPVFEGFESWINGCSTTDLPSNKWVNNPATGNTSWRREDQTASASWSALSYYTPPLPFEGSHMARYNAYYAGVTNSNDPEGKMSLYIDCSGSTGNKELEYSFNFAYPYPYAPYTYPGDSINVDMSTDGGATWTTIDRRGNLPNGWNTISSVQIPSSSATTVIRFRAKAFYTYADDIYLDAVRVVPACSGTPVAGVIDSLKPCSGQAFKLSTTGTSAAAGLAYQWEYRPVGSTGWAPLPGGNVAKPMATITSNTEFRVIVTCTNSSLSDTSAAVLGVLQPFYYCYCSFVPQYTYAYNNIGNVTVTSAADPTMVKLNNGNALPTLSNTTATKTYSDFRRTVAAGTLIRDSLYRIIVSITTSQSYFYGNGYPANSWLDSNRDGIFQSGERILNRNVASQANPTARDTFRINRNAKVGLTGMRVSHFPYYSAPVNPCGAYGYQGEVEDYLMYIEYQPCAGPVNPGTAFISDTEVCPGYTVDLWDTSYERKRTGIYRDWQISTNNGASWSMIPGSAMKDTLTNVVIPRFNPTVYRLRVTCPASNDTTYSNILRVTTPDPVRCYPVAQAVIGGNDSSDIGAFRLGNFVNPAPPATAGPHILNPAARRRRTDYTMLGPIYLQADSPTRLSIFHTMPGANHADAMVSVFIDFNNDLLYQTTGTSIYPSELVYQGTTNSANFFLDTVITMPHNLIPKRRTGVRVVINNDMNPTAGGNTGTGTFSSGEVEDYIAIFGRDDLNVNSGVGLLQSLSLFPNPTEGRFTLQSDATRAVSHIDVTVTTITGQQVLNRSFDNVGTHFSTPIDLSGAAKGIYFVELRADGEKITRKLVIR